MFSTTEFNFFTTELIIHVILRGPRLGIPHRYGVIPHRLHPKLRGEAFHPHGYYKVERPASLGPGSWLGACQCYESCWFSANCIAGIEFEESIAG